MSLWIESTKLLEINFQNGGGEISERPKSVGPRNRCITKDVIGTEIKR